jgi:hypothetical protein
MMPFSRDQFLGVFASYHEEWWLAVWFFYAGAAVVLAAIGKCSARTAFRVAAFCLGIAWAWIGVAYHWMHFRPINPAAGAFAGLFLAQGLLFLKQAVLPGGGRFERPAGLPRLLGGGLAAYSLVIYPVLGYLSGHGYPNGPSFGLPCPTTIFTFAVLLLTVSDFQKLLWLAAIPVAWSFIATFAAIEFGIVEDWALLPSALIAVGVAYRSRPREGRGGVSALRPRRPSSSRRSRWSGDRHRPVA